jgi:excisionase family DNA binding protein
MLHVADVADLLGVSVRSVHELTRKRASPFRKVEGTRRVLFLEDELRAWVQAGRAAPLEVVEGERGSVVVRLGKVPA